MGSGGSKGPTRVVTQQGSSSNYTGPHRNSTVRRGSKLSNNNNGSPVKHIKQAEVGMVDTTMSNTLFERVFLITTGCATGADLPGQCALLNELAKKKTLLQTSNIEEAVFERLLLTKFDIINRASNRGPSENGTSEEPCAFIYLYYCYLRYKAALQDTKFVSSDVDLTKCKEVIFLNSKTCLLHTDLFPKQHIPRQFIDLCYDNKDTFLDKESKIHEFLIEMVTLLESDTEKSCLLDAFTPVFVDIRQTLLHAGLMHLDVGQFLEVLKFFACRKSLSEIFMEFNSPSDWTLGCSYEQTLLGAALALSSCPKTNKGPYEFFTNPLNTTSQEIHKTTMQVWQYINTICDQIVAILYPMLKLHADIIHKILYWIGKCLEANRGKPNLWSAHEAEVFDKLYCSDGFCLNLGYVMLRLCTPFAVPNGDKMLKIKPTYTRVDAQTEDEIKSASVHALGLTKESVFVPYTDDKHVTPEKSYNFITECFFLAHQALNIGYSIVYKVLKLSNNINRLDKLHSEIKDLYPKKVVELVKHQLNKEVCWYLNLKAAISEYHMTKMCLDFHIATATWLVQVATTDDVTAFQPITFPLAKDVPKTLSCLPEIILSNLTMFIVSLELFKNVDLLKSDLPSFQHFTSLVLVYMGSPERLKSSDIQAQLAEALESMLPKVKADGSFESSQSGNEDTIFKEHPLIEHLAEKLLNVFVVIEMTGQSVDSEKKFNYRKSMHKIIQYLWKIPLHRQAITTLADDAMSRIEDTDPPLFLRFINMLINDAIFLLDEALDHMKQIREQELERDEGKWLNLSAEQLRDKETSLRHLGMMGRHRNIMANHSVYTFEVITREIKNVFCHSVMVDRVAGMLNYFLQHLVSQKQRDYKVKDRKEYDFKPEQLVSDIAHIYVYLGKSDKFCNAVIGESRSFSCTLLEQAVVVLTKIGVNQEFVNHFTALTSKLKTLAEGHQEQDDVLADAPEEFLDPIMGTLFTDPVILPSSNVTVDKAVLARHLLSDQSDPFNREPLSMDMVVPNIQLKHKIDKWKKKHMKG